jgi:hypothetical protein
MKFHVRTIDTSSNHSSIVAANLKRSEGFKVRSVVVLKGTPVQSKQWFTSVSRFSLWVNQQTEIWRTRATGMINPF